MTKTIRDIEALAASVAERVIKWQRTIHADPEIGFDTVRTAALAARVLRESGLAVREGIGRTGVVADIDVPGSEKRLAFRADMDALPMDEENDLPHKSRNPGAAHMCGHDAHTAMLLGAATALAGARESIPCSLRFIFQPNEENLPGGAPAMIADGCLDGVDRIYGMHVWPLIDTGLVGVHNGPTMASPDNWRITVTGVGGHAAAPFKCRDPIPVAAEIVSALQTIVARSVNPLDAAVLSVTQFHAGTADNVIPAAAELRGTIRTFRPEVGEVARERLVEVARGVAGAHGVTVEIDVERGFPVVFNEEASCEAALGALDGVARIDEGVEPTLGGEDFAYYGEKIPAAFLFLGNRNEAKGTHYFCHHPRFLVDDDAMSVGVSTWLALALRGGEC